MTERDDSTEGNPQLLAQRCTVHDEHRWYLPRLVCPYCGGEAVTFAPAGTGTVFATTTVQRRADGGTAVGIALVDLDDGIRIMARCEPETAIRDRVEIGFITDENSGAVVPAATKKQDV